LAEQEVQESHKEAQKVLLDRISSLEAAMRVANEASLMSYQDTMQIKSKLVEKEMECLELQVRHWPSHGVAVAFDVVRASSYLLETRIVYFRLHITVVVSRHALRSLLCLDGEQCELLQVQHTDMVLAIAGCNR
jgi:hypothetical protein